MIHAPSFLVRPLCLAALLNITPGCKSANEADESAPHADVAASAASPAAGPATDEPPAIVHEQSGVRRIELANTYLDEAARRWRKQEKCMTCHTTVYYLMARPRNADGTAPEVVTKIRELADRRRQIFESGDNPCLPERASPRETSDGTCPLASGDTPNDARLFEVCFREEVALTAGLVLNDAASKAGSLSPEAEAALNLMWEHQLPEGSWTWFIPDGWPPFEIKDRYHGATVAAVAAATAIRELGYQPMGQAETGWPRLQTYLQTTAPRNLHSKAMIVWVVTLAPSLMVPDTQLSGETIAAHVHDLLAAQDSEGWWSQDRMNDWNCFAERAWKADCLGCPKQPCTYVPTKRGFGFARIERDWGPDPDACPEDCANEANCPPRRDGGDAYPTAFVTYVLMQVRARASSLELPGLDPTILDAPIERGISWLKGQQILDDDGVDGAGIPLKGSWPTRSRRIISDHNFIVRAATAWAVIALREHGKGDAPSG